MPGSYARGTKVDDPATGPLNQSSVAIQITPTLIDNTSNRRLLVISNDSEETIYIGNSDVATSGAEKGISISPGVIIPFKKGELDDAVYGIAANVATIQKGVAV